MPPVVREATQADLEGIAQLIQEVADEGIYIWTERMTDERRAQLSRQIGDPRALVAVSVLDQDVIGCLTLSRYGEARKTAHVRSLFMAVARDERGRGVGTGLMAYSLAWARRRRIRKISLGVFASNGRAKRLYERFGFEVEGVLKGQQKIGRRYVDQIEMGLALTRPNR